MIVFMFKFLGAINLTSSFGNEITVVFISFEVNWSILKEGFVNTISKRLLNSPTSEVKE